MGSMTSGLVVVRVTDHNMFPKRNSQGSSVADANISSSSSGPGKCSGLPPSPVKADGVGNGMVSLPESSASVSAAGEEMLCSSVSVEFVVVDELSKFLASEKSEGVDELSQEGSSENSSDAIADVFSLEFSEADASNRSDGKMGRLIMPASTLAVRSFFIFTASSYKKHFSLRP